MKKDRLNWLIEQWKSHRMSLILSTYDIFLLFFAWHFGYKIFFWIWLVLTIVGTFYCSSRIVELEKEIKELI